MNKKELLKKIEQYESEGRFNELVQPPSKMKKKPVKNFNYTRKGFWAKLGTFFVNPFFKFISIIISKFYRLKILGKENLKKVKGAIVTSNHINNLDCVLLRRALLHKKYKVTVAEFNNFKNPLGWVMRCAGTMPFGESYESAKNMSKAISELLNKNNMIVFYPEQALWWCYEKPRPTMKGAYHFASKNNKPIIPMFFTFKNLKKKKDGAHKKKFFLHIGKPIYPQPDKTLNENVEYLQNTDFEWRKSVYEKFYGKNLTYNIKK